MKLQSKRHFAIALFILVASTIPACKSGDHGSQATLEKLPTAVVKTTTATVSSPVRQVEIMGSVQAADSASIAAKISGNITNLPINLGSRVKKGDTLLSISAGEISAKLLQAQAHFDQADRNLKRERILLKKNAATPAKVKTLEETKQIAEAAYNEAKTMLGYTTIKAPFDGVVTRKTANIGDLATPGKPLLQLENESRLQIITDIPEALILEIKQGDILPVYIPAADLRTSGTVSEVAPAADPRSRTAPVKLDIPTEAKIRSGQFARVSLPGKHGKAVMIPDSAVLPFGQMDRVFVARDDVAYLQLVKTGLHYNDLVEILAGISPGDEIIISGNEHLKDGQPIALQ